MRRSLNLPSKRLYLSISLVISSLSCLLEKMSFLIVCSCSSLFTSFICWLCKAYSSSSIRRLRAGSLPLFSSFSLIFEFSLFVLSSWTFYLSMTLLSESTTSSSSATDLVPLLLSFTVSPGCLAKSSPVSLADYSWIVASSSSLWFLSTAESWEDEFLYYSRSVIRF